MLLTLVPFLSGCEKEPDIKGPQQPAGFVELIKAYKDGKVFQSAEHQNGNCVISFTDGYRLTIASTAFEIHDCTGKTPAKVEPIGSWWSVDGRVFGIKVDSTLPDEQSLPVYVYFDSKTLYAHLSNRTVLTFPSKVLEEEENEQIAIERRQNIPVVYITTKNSAPIVDKKNYVSGSIKIIDSEKLYSDVEVFTADMGIRGRGNSTWSFPKKPWKVKLNSKASLLGMPADKEWALLANYADRTLIRNIVAMKLSEICGFSWTPRMRSVEVFLNGKYQGVYTLCEHKKVSSDRVDIDLVGENDNEGDAVTGGYYLEIEEQQDETTCWWTSMGVPMMFSDPEEPTAQQLAYVKGLFDSLVKRLKLLIEILDIIKIWGDRLIDKVICQNHRLVLIVLGDLLPDVAEKLLGSLAFEQPRVAIAVVDVVACLSSWSIVHIEDDIETIFTAPADGIVKPFKAILIGSQSHIVLVCEELVVEWDTDGVGSCRSDELNVLFSHIVVLEHLPELCSKVRTDHFTEHLVYKSCGICLLEAEHIALRIKPVAEICSLDEELGSVRSHKVLSVDPDEIGGRNSSAGVATAEHQTCNECKQSQS